MSATTQEVWQWNGVTLNQPYWNITTFGGNRFAIPLLRGQNIEVAYTAGQQWRFKAPDSRVITLLMWAAGINQSTGNPDSQDQITTFNNNFQQLRQMFWTRNINGSVQGSLTRNWNLTQNSVTGLVTATAQAEIAGTFEPTMTGRTRADFQVDLLLADPYFYGAQQSQTLPYNSGQTVVNLGEGVAGEGFGGTMTVKFSGPLTNPTLTNQTAGVSVTYNATIASGISNAVTLDCVNFTALTGGGANVIANVAHSGARRWFGLLGAGSSAGDVCKLTSTNGADTGTCVLTWAAPYL